MSWPYMLRWLYSMYLYTNPDANLRFGLNHGTGMFIPFAFFCVIGCCYIIQRRKKNARLQDDVQSYD